MQILFDLSGNWRFLYHNEVTPEGVPVEISEEKSELRFSIPYGIKGLTIKLDSFNNKEQSMSGSYTIHDVGLSDSVTFRIQENASQWIGTPEGFHGTVKWKLWRESM